MTSVARKPSIRQAGLWRLNLVIVLLLGMLLVLVVRVLSLQILDTERGYAFLQNEGEARSLRSTEIPAYRGVITDRRGEPLAVSTPVVSIWADPQRLSGSAQLPALAESLSMPLAELERKLALYASKRFMYLKRHLKPQQAREILSLPIPGLHGEREYRRFYPAGEVAAQLVGFTDIDDKGIAGIELAYEDWLRGRPGKKKYIKDLRGNMVRDIGVVQPAAPGRDLHLSIDLRLQHLQHRELRRAVTAAQAESGSVVTLDARTGEVLALVNYPVYNPNSRKVQDAENLRNRAITDSYEPGSTMKTLTLVAALESGRYTTDTLIDTTPGWIRVGPKTYQDPRNYGEVTLSRVLEKSSQVGVTLIARDLGHEPILNVFRRFGIGEPPGTGFPGESVGVLPDRQRWYSTERISLAFGYGITATPLQLAHIYSAFANGGLQRPVSLLALDGELPEARRVVSTAVAAQVLDVLHAVTGEHGTAGKARVDGYEVAGKTGTVRKAGPGGYKEDAHIALFAGLAPAEHPRIVTVVVINDPKGEDYGGGAVAAPVFSAVVRGALRLLGEIPETVTASASMRSGAA